VSMSF